jgi:hypothetical protein
VSSCHSQSWQDIESLLPTGYEGLKFSAIFDITELDGLLSHLRSKKPEGLNLHEEPADSEPL